MPRGCASSTGSLNMQCRTAKAASAREVQAMSGKRVAMSSTVQAGHGLCWMPQDSLARHTSGVMLNRSSSSSSAASMVGLEQHLQQEHCCQAVEPEAANLPQQLKPAMKKFDSSLTECRTAMAAAAQPALWALSGTRGKSPTATLAPQSWPSA